MNLKAYVVFTGDGPYDNGCQLVYAQSRDKARYHCYLNIGDLIGSDYIDYRARRAPDFDKYAKGEKAYRVRSNNELPEPFYDDSYF